MPHPERADTINKFTNSFIRSLCIHQTWKVSFVPRICWNTKMNTRICLSTQHYQCSQRQRQRLITELCEECYGRASHRSPGEPGWQERGWSKSTALGETWPQHDECRRATAAQLTANRSPVTGNLSHEIIQAWLSEPRPELQTSRYWTAAPLTQEQEGLRTDIIPV